MHLYTYTHKKTHARLERKTGERSVHTGSESHCARMSGSRSRARDVFSDDKSKGSSIPLTLKHTAARETVRRSPKVPSVKEARFTFSRKTLLLLLLARRFLYSCALRGFACLGATVWVCVYMCVVCVCIRYM